jgi:hypothetical protein
MPNTEEQKAKNAAYYRSYYAKNKDKIRLRIRNKNPSKNPRIKLSKEEKAARRKERKRKNTYGAKYTSKEGRIKYMLFKARTRAKEKNMEFSISINDLSIPDLCPLLEIPIVWDVATGAATPNSPSLDRIDNTKGYVKGNVWVISMRANFIKASATPEELEKLATNLKFFTVKSNG